MGKTEKKAGDGIHHKKTKFSIDGERKRIKGEEKDQPVSKDRIGVRREKTSREGGATCTLNLRSNYIWSLHG